MMGQPNSPIPNPSLMLDLIALALRISNTLSSLYITQNFVSIQARSSGQHATVNPTRGN